MSRLQAVLGNTSDRRDWSTIARRSAHPVHTEAESLKSLCNDCDTEPEYTTITGRRRLYWKISAEARPKAFRAVKWAARPALDASVKLHTQVRFFRWGASLRCLIQFSRVGDGQVSSQGLCYGDYHLGSRIEHDASDFINYILRKAQASSDAGTGQMDSCA